VKKAAKRGIGVKINFLRDLGPCVTRAGMIRGVSKSGEKKKRGKKTLRVKGPSLHLRDNNTPPDREHGPEVRGRKTRNRAGAFKGRDGRDYSLVEGGSSADGRVH